jgi:hypothetical protein
LFTKSGRGSSHTKDRPGSQLKATLAISCADFITKKMIS